MIDLKPTPTQRALRDEAAAWLEENVPDEPLESLDTAIGFEQHREWERKLHDGGWGAISWPKELGGRDASLTEWLLFEEAYYRSGAPSRVNQNGLFLLGPTLLEHGSTAQRQRFLPPMASGDEIWAQAWSEPDAGSDMAAIRTTAVRTDGSYVVSGQKTWVSRGAFADWMFALVRTDPESSRHRGLSFLLIPLDAPGVTVRPIRQISGETGFAEVFLEEVAVPLENRVGAENAGWSIAMSTAGFERGIYLRSPGRFRATARRLVELYAGRGDDAPDGTRAAITRAWMDAEAYALHTQSTVTRAERGEKLGPESSFNKIFWSEMDRSMHETALRLLGCDATLTGNDAAGRHHGSEWLDGYLFSLSGPIYAGTNEIQRNIVADRVLRLPSEG